MKEIHYHKIPEILKNRGIAWLRTATHGSVFFIRFNTLSYFGFDSMLTTLMMIFYQLVLEIDM